jgi:hydrogenase maturation protease
VAAPSAPSGHAPRIVVLGIGNLLWADEGFGVRCVEALRAGWDFAPHIELVDGGTQGLYLLPWVQSADRLLILDAVDYGLAPGTLKVVENDAVPRFLGAKKMSLHQTGFQDVLMLAQLSGHLPRDLVLIGCQPEVLDDFGGSLHPTVKHALAGALSSAIDRLAAWGARPVPRVEPRPAGEGLHAPSLRLADYEAGRPSAEAACRSGDARFMRPTPGAASPLPLEGAPPAAWQSQFRGSHAAIAAGTPPPHDRSDNGA